MIRSGRQAIRVVLGLFLLSIGNDAFAASKLLSTMQKLGIKSVACPKYVGHLKSGLVTSVMAKDTICVKIPKIKALKGVAKQKPFPIDGTAQLGYTFPNVIQQEGDVQTMPFAVRHYPALISFDVKDASLKNTFKIGLYDSSTGEAIDSSIVETDGPTRGIAAISSPGDFFVKLQDNAATEKEEDFLDEIQPIFSASMAYMDQYQGFSIAREDLKDAGAKTIPCPTYMIDKTSGYAYKVGEKFVCSNSKPEVLEDAGFTHAPFNLRVGIFLTQEVDMAANCSLYTLPFRVLRPTALTYSVDDPAEGQGRFRGTLYELGLSNDTKMISTTGNISSTTTFMNIPGDYIFGSIASPSNPKKYGLMSWSIEIETTP